MKEIIPEKKPEEKKELNLKTVLKLIVHLFLIYAALFFCLTVGLHIRERYF